MNASCTKWNVVLQCLLKKNLKKVVYRITHQPSTKVVKSNCRQMQKKRWKLLQKYNNEQHLVQGKTLPIDQQKWHVEVVSCFLRAAVPLNKMQFFRNLLEENACHLTDWHYLSDLIPLILHQEHCNIWNETSGRDISVIFNGRWSSCFCVVIYQFWLDHWTVLNQDLAVIPSIWGEEWFGDYSCIVNWLQHM